METRDLKQIIKILENSSLESIEIEQNGVRICVKKPSAPTVMQGAIMNGASTMSAGASANAEQSDGNNPGDVKSPLVGTFYSRPNPEEKPFVSLGDTVKEGQTLCIVEAMKVMNEIKAPKSGKVTAIKLTDGDMVEFDQVILTIE